MTLCSAVPLKHRHREISNEFGERLAMKYGLVLLAELIRNHEERWEIMRLDQRLKPEFVDSFHRILFIHFVNWRSIE